MFKIATWNVNSLRVRLPHLINWLTKTQPDIVALQEIKMVEEECPLIEFEQLGYKRVAAGQKAYNGVALLSKENITDVVTAMLDYDDPQKRLLAATIGDVRVLNVYVPNGQALHSEKFQYKLEWEQYHLEGKRGILGERGEHNKL